MEPSESSFTVSIVCAPCGGEIQLGQRRCPSCNRELTREELGALRARLEASDPVARRSGDKAAYGRFALLVVAGWSVIEGILDGVVGASTSVLAFCGVIAAIMTGLFFWAARRPLAAMVTGLAIYAGLHLVAFLVSPGILLQGLRVKILIVFGAGIAAELSFRRRENRNG
jgi:hypothetical protein